MRKLSSETEINKAIEELKQRAAVPKPVFYDPTFDKQTAFIQDLAKFKAALCTRRAGKSYGDGLELFDNAYNTESVSCLYVALTRDSAKRIMFRDVLGTINKRMGLNAKPNLTDLTWTLPNQSTIYLLGMDSSPEEAEKALGQKFKKVVIDEAGSFRRDLRQIIYGILSPACADLGGTISMTGTPTSLTKGFYFDVVNGKEPGWSNHQWSAFDNPYMAVNWQKEIDDLIAKNPLVIETPWFKQMYLGQYVVDESKLVYRFSEARNSTAQLPDGLNYVLGVDLGFDDPSAFSVVGYSRSSPNLYIVETYKKSGMIISDVAERIKYYQQRYNPYKIVIDNAAKQSVEELRRRFSLPLTPAEKAGKSEFIEIMNSEMIQGRIKALPENELLFEEYANLIWDEKSTRREEHPACDNHLTDATLYAWRYCFQYLFQPAAPKMNEQQKLDLWLDKEGAKVLAVQQAHSREEEEQSYWEREFN